MDIQNIILGSLMDESRTGYEIKQLFSVSFGFFSGMSYGSIYPALKNMEQDGLITVQMQIQESAPNRKICTITDKGREHFLNSMRAPLPLDRYKNSFMTRLFFFAHLKPEERKAVARDYLEILNKNQRRLMKIEPVIKDKADPFQWICFECGLRFVEDLRNNMSQAIADMENYPKSTG